MPITFDQLSSEQKEVCIRYIQNTGTFAFELNARLRNNAIQGTLWEEPLAILDSIFRIEPQGTNPMLLFRGTKDDIQERLDPDANTFSSFQFMSVSLDENIAARFANTPPELFLRIHFQCSNIRLLNLDHDGNNTMEGEFLIPRNTRFRVLYNGVYNDFNSLRHLGVADSLEELHFIGICPIV